MLYFRTTDRWINCFSLRVFGPEAGPISLKRRFSRSKNCDRTKSQFCSEFSCSYSVARSRSEMHSGTSLRSVKTGQVMP